MNVNDIRVGEASYLLLFIPLYPLPLHHLVRSIHICMNLANSSLRMRRIPYVYSRACKRKRVRETYMFGSTCEGRSASCASPRAECESNSFLTRNYHALSRASPRASLTEFIRYYPDLRIDSRTSKKHRIRMYYIISRTFRLQLLLITNLYVDIKNVEEFSEKL